MIVSKKDVTINAQNGGKAKIYLSLVSYGRDCLTGNWVVNVLAMTNVEGKYEELSTNLESYSHEKFSEFFGSLTIDDIVEKENELLIQQIALNSDKYWGLTVDDLEVSNS